LIPNTNPGITGRYDACGKKKERLTRLLGSKHSYSILKHLVR